MTIITIKGGKALLVLGDGAVAHLTNNDDTKMFCVSTTNAKLVYNRHPIGAVLTNGAASELPPLWALKELRFLGLRLQPKRPRSRKISLARKARYKTARHSS
jgi:hypothetical protein